MGSGVDGRSNQMFHSLNKGTAQIKVEKCGGYTSSKKATVTLRKSKKTFPYYTNCGTIKFYKKGTYTFGSVGKGSYWLYVSGNGEKKRLSMRQERFRIINYEYRDHFMAVSTAISYSHNNSGIDSNKSFWYIENK